MVGDSGSSRELQESSHLHRFWMLMSQRDPQGKMSMTVNDSDNAFFFWLRQQ